MSHLALRNSRACVPDSKSTMNCTDGCCVLHLLSIGGSTIGESTTDAKLRESTVHLALHVLVPYTTMRTENFANGPLARG